MEFRLHLVIISNKPDSQSCAVAKSKTLWRATGQSNLADRMLHWPKCSVWVQIKKDFESFCCGQTFVCQVWLSSGPYTSILATAHDCETGSLQIFVPSESWSTMHYDTFSTNQVHWWCYPWSKSLMFPSINKVSLLPENITSTTTASGPPNCVQTQRLCGRSLEHPTCLLRMNWFGSIQAWYNLKLYWEKNSRGIFAKLCQFLKLGKLRLFTSIFLFTYSVFAKTVAEF